jgi:hypothetical protein
MATQCAGGFGIYYLYYDWSGPAAREHRKEIERFAARVGAELDFRALSYQALFLRLQQSAAAADRDYLTYLQARYFSAGPLPP